MCAVAMDFSCITILHIVDVTPKEKWLVCSGRCRMHTRLEWTCTHMSGALPVTYGLAWHPPPPTLADSCTIESRGTFSHVSVHWAWFFMLLISAKSIHTVCTRVMSSRTTRECQGLEKIIFQIMTLIQSSQIWKTGKSICRNGH